jgi:hypothetical protein
VKAQLLPPTPQGSRENPQNEVLMQIFFVNVFTVTENEAFAHVVGKIKVENMGYLCIRSSLFRVDLFYN